MKTECCRCGRKMDRNEEITLRFSWIEGTFYNYMDTKYLCEKCAKQVRNWCNGEGFIVDE